METRRGFGFVAAFCMMLATAGSPALAYQETGHYYTIDLVVSGVSPSWAPEEAKLISLCAQIPDATYEFDAVKQYTHMLIRVPSFVRWLSSHHDANTSRMLTTQQLVHALTGGKVDDMHDVATHLLDGLNQQVRKQAPGYNRNAALCALGIGVHLYGDSFAHRRMGPKDTAHMYGTGLGHFWDGTYPDLPLCSVPTDEPWYQRFDNHCGSGDGHSGRFQQWIDYLKDAATHLGKNGAAGSLPQDLVEHIRGAVFSKVAGAGDFNEYNERATEDALSGEWDNGHGIAVPLISLGKLLRNSSNSCQSVLDLVTGYQEPGSAKASGPSAALVQLQDLPGLLCDDVWRAYAPVVEEIFNDPKLAAARESDVPHDYLDPLTASECPAEPSVGSNQRRCRIDAKRGLMAGP